MQKFLFNYKLKFWGLALLIPSFIIGFIRFYLGIKPEIFDTKVFAIYSYYLEKKYFVVIENQVSEEIAGILLLISLFLIAFSKEKNETELTQTIRNKALFFSFILNYVFIFLSFLFMYGFAFLDMLMINIYSQLVFYILSFRLMIIYFNRKNCVKK